MTPLRAAALAVTLLAAPPAAAGEVASCFVPGAGGACVEPVLQHVEFKSVVTEFVDPAGMGLGHSLSRLLWREVLESIGDVAGAGVILAHDAEREMRRLLDGRDYREFLETDYHQAALEIARALDVQMSLWGVVLSEGDAVYIQSFLTLLPGGEDDPWTRLRLSNRQLEDGGLSVDIARGRLAFAPVETDRAALFDRRLAVRCALRAGCPGGVPLRAGPSNDRPVSHRVPEGRSVAVEDMTEQWLRVRLDDGDTAWINIYHVHVTPASVHAAGKTDVNLRPEPAGAASLGRFDFAGSYAVRDVAVDDRGRRWFRVVADGTEGWVAGWLFEPDYTFPVVHFTEGLYRYARLDFDGAVRALERFLARGAETESNVTLAAARRFLAAARLAGSGAADPEAAERALSDLDAATDLTPFDPDLRLMRALVRFGAFDRFEGGVADLAAAVELDDRSPAVRDLLGRVAEATRRPGGAAALNGGPPPPPEAEARLQALLAER